MERWYAIKTPKDFEAERVLASECSEVYFPKERVVRAGGAMRERPIIPHVLFVKAEGDRLLELEKRGRNETDRMVPFWIYRYVRGGDIQAISDREIALIKLLTAADPDKCEIYNKAGFEEGQRVRVTGGAFAGYEGYVQRVRRNKHVVVRIEGICAVMLPFIHPDLLAPQTD